MTDDEIMLRLILGNIGDEVALRNICEVHCEEVEELTDEERDFLIHTNHFYYSEEEFYEMHDADVEEFQWLIDHEVLLKTTDGYVYKNCV